MTNTVQVREIATKTKTNGDGHNMDLHDEPVVQRPKPEKMEEHSPTPAEPVSPPKPGRRPWVWALTGAAAVAATAAGIGYYIHCLSFESTDDAFIEGHVVPVSSRVPRHVAKVCIEDNQLVQKGDLLVELDSADFQTRLAGAVAVEIDGQVVGATFGLPDYNPRIRKINGRLFPFGFIHLLRNKRAIKRIRVISTNVLPAYQLHGLGLVLLDGLVPKALEWGIEEAEFSWVLESNAFSRGALKKGGAKITKTYRLYDLDESRGEGSVLQTTL